MVDRRMLCPGVVLFLTVCLVTPGVWAGTLSSVDMKVGPFELMPELTFREVYSDNIYREEVDKDDDFRSLVTFGTDAKLRRGHYGLTLGYRGIYRRSRDYSEFNRLDQVFDGEFKVRFKSGVTITLAQELKKWAIEPNYPGDDLHDYLHNVTTGRILFPVTEKTGVEVVYAYHRRDFSEPKDELDNFRKDQYSVRFVYNYSVKTGFFVEYTAFFVDNAIATTDNKKHDVFGGVQLNLTDKVVGIVRAGYTTIRFVDNEDPSDFGVRADLIFRAGPKTKIRVEVLRDLEETSLTGENAINGNYFLFTGGAVKLEQGLGRKFLLLVNGAISHSDFPKPFQDVLRKDDFYNAGAELVYDIQPWLKLGGGYSWADNNSTIFQNSYTGNMGYGYLSFLVKE
ncbi:outer membrane beta-barrel protein [Acidobacteriota bacterium]